MNSVILKYLLYGYLKNLFKVTLFFYCFGIILNLFEEIEFFKNLDVTIFTPLMLTSLHIPGMLIQLFPFIIFITSMKFILDLKNNRDLLTIKIFDIQTLKYFFISFYIFYNRMVNSFFTESNYFCDVDLL